MRAILPILRMVEFAVIPLLHQDKLDPQSGAAAFWMMLVAGLLAGMLEARLIGSGGDV